jgi:hypothetical protein
LLDDFVGEIHRYSGRLLLKLRERIVNGEAEDIKVVAMVLTAMLRR